MQANLFSIIYTNNLEKKNAEEWMRVRMKLQSFVYNILVWFSICVNGISLVSRKPEMSPKFSLYREPWNIPRAFDWLELVWIACVSENVSVCVEYGRHYHYYWLWALLLTNSKTIFSTNMTKIRFHRMFEGKNIFC